MKFYNYAIIVTTLALIFELAGIPVAAELLTRFGISSTGLDINGSAVWLAIIGISVVGSITVGFLTKTSPENYIIWPIVVLYFAILITPMVGIVSAAGNILGTSNWIFKIILFVMSVLAVGFIIAVLEFFRGTD